MELNIFAVYDAKSECYGRPFFLQTLGQAIRSFTDEINRPSEDNSMWKHSEDFALWHLGIWTDYDGRFKGLDIPRLLVQGSEVKSGQDFPENKMILKGVSKV